jgi:hypothetical protein
MSDDQTSDRLDYLGRPIRRNSRVRMNSEKDKLIADPTRQIGDLKRESERGASSPNAGKKEDAAMNAAAHYIVGCAVIILVGMVLIAWFADRSYRNAERAAPAASEPPPYFDRNSGGSAKQQNWEQRRNEGVMRHYFEEKYPDVPAEDRNAAAKRIAEEWERAKRNP